MQPLPVLKIAIIGRNENNARSLEGVLRKHENEFDSHVSIFPSLKHFVDSDPTSEKVAALIIHLEARAILPINELNELEEWAKARTKIGRAILVCGVSPLDPKVAMDWWGKFSERFERYPEIDFAWHQIASPRETLQMVETAVKWTTRALLVHKRENVSADHHCPPDW